MTVTVTEYPDEECRERLYQALDSFLEYNGVETDMMELHSIELNEYNKLKVELKLRSE